VCVCVRLWFFLLTYCAMGQFEGVTLATEWISWWWHPWRTKTCRRLTNVW